MKCNELAFVVLNYNSSDITVKCVDNLLSFSMDFHIVIVDNSSPDNSFLKLKDYYSGMCVDVIKSNSNNGYSAGNNIGIRFAEENYGVKYIAIVNPDVIIPEKCIVEELLATLTENDRCAVVGAMPVENLEATLSHAAWPIPTESEFIKSKSIFYRKKIADIRITKNVMRVDCVAGCFFIITMEALRNIGYLDEDIFMYDEEILLGYNLKKEGFYELLRTDLRYYHNHIRGKSPTLENYIAKRRVRFASDVTLFEKIYGNKVGLAALYAIEYTNRFALFFWFLYKKLKYRSKE